VTHETDTTPPYRWAGVTFVLVMAIYYVTLAPTTAFWDTSEYIAAAKVLGIPHPPGNPFFTVLAHVWGLLPLGADYARRINLFAAVTSAAGAAFWFLVAERWCRNVLAARGPRIAAAIGGVLAGATAWTVWNQSTVNEKVYTVSLLTIALVSWFAVRWADQPVGERRDRWLLAAIYVLALTSTNHQMGILAAPVLGVYVLFTDWRMLTTPWFLATTWLLLMGLGGQLGAVGSFLVGAAPLDAAAGLGTVIALALIAWAVMRNPRHPAVWVGIAIVVVGFSLNYVYLPIRAAQFPPINEGEPLGFFSKALSDVLGRVQYAKPSVTDRQTQGFLPQLAMYWQYWSWQWGRDLGALAAPVTGLFSAITVGGLWTLLRKDRRAGLAAAALLGTLTLLLIFYLNFKYGFSYHPNDPTITLEMREVRERDYFFVASFAFAGVLIAIGLAAMVRGIGDWLGSRVPDSRRYLTATPVLVLALVPLIGNHTTASRAHETLPHDFAVDILESVEPYGILITAGDNDTFPLWFAQEVLGVRRDVTLANLSLMNTDWHLRQLLRRDIPDFDPATANPIWRPGTDSDSLPLWGTPAQQWPRPTDPVFSLTLAGLDSLPELSQTPPGGGIQFGDLAIRFGVNYLTRSDIATILLIRDNLGQRPIYFSWSDGLYPDNTLGLQQYLVTEGLVRRLSPTPVVPDGQRIVISRDIGYVNAPRTRALLDNVYHWEAAARARPAGWVDIPSESILSLYNILYGSWANLLREQGDTVAAARPDSIARAIRRNFR
jgi:hypothetical protein